MMLKIHGTFSSLHKPSLSDGCWFPINKTKVLYFQISLSPRFPSSFMPVWRGNHRLLLSPVLSKEKSYLGKVNKLLLTSVRNIRYRSSLSTSSNTRPVLFHSSWSHNFFEYTPQIRIVFHHHLMPNSFSMWFTFTAFCLILAFYHEARREHLSSQSQTKSMCIPARENRIAWLQYDFI